MKYPIIVIGNVRYAPYALMEMQGDEVISLKTLTGARLAKGKRWAIKPWFKKLMTCGR